MPSEHGLRSDDQECALPTPEGAREQDEQAPIRVGEARAFDRPVEHDELLPEEEVLGD